MKIDDQKLDELIKDFYASEVWQKTGHFDLIRNLLSNRGLQANHTPIALCKEMLAKLNETVRLADANILVLFNLEFVDVLINHFGVNPQNITFFADDILEADAARQWYNVNCPTDIITYDRQSKEPLLPNIKKKFDVVVMNPPYQAPKERSTDVEVGMCGSKLWTEFVKFSFDLLKDKGHAAHVHPGSWRKPGHSSFATISQYHLRFLSMHNIVDGQKMFKVATGFDWYVATKERPCGETEIRSMDGIVEKVNIQNLPFLPCSNFTLISSLLADNKEERCNVLFSHSMYESRKSWMLDSNKPEGKFQYPCVYGLTQKDGLKVWHSSEKGDFIGIKKVIIPLSKYTDAFVDDKGTYGICQFAFGIEIDSKEEGEQIARILKSESFKPVWNAMEWIYNGKEWRGFKYFRKDFWKEFI